MLTPVIKTPARYRNITGSFDLSSSSSAEDQLARAKAAVRSLDTGIRSLDAASNILIKLMNNEEVGQLPD